MARALAPAASGSMRRRATGWELACVPASNMPAAYSPHHPVPANQTGASDPRGRNEGDVMETHVFGSAPVRLRSCRVLAGCAATDLDACVGPPGYC